MPSRTIPAPRNCPIARTLDLLGDRWSLLVMREVLYGEHRFESIFQHTGAPRDVLAERLRRLVDAGLLERRPYNEGGTRFEYHATALGLAVRPILLAIGEFGEATHPELTPRWRTFFGVAPAAAEPSLDGSWSDGARRAMPERA